MMLRGLLTITTFLSVIFFPWPFASLMAVITSLYEPWVAFAAGMFADTLYYAPTASRWPVYTVFGAVMSVIVLFVRARIKASIIET